MKICPVCGFNPSSSIFKKFQEFIDKLVYESILKNKDFPELMHFIKVPDELTTLVLLEDEKIRPEIAKFVEKAVKNKFYSKQKVMILYVYYCGKIDVFIMKEKQEEYISFKLKIRKLLNQMDRHYGTTNEFIAKVRELAEED